MDTQTTGPKTQEPSAARALPPTPLQVLKRAWRRLRTMRTALMLLLLLAAGASLGAFFPQRPVNPFAVTQWIDRHPQWAGLAERFGLFDVYGAWWFMAIYALLLVSLIGCLAGRYRAFVRALRARPRATASLSGMPHYHAGLVPAEPQRVLAGAERVLRRRRFRFVRENGSLAAEKGHLREGGSILFHTAFLLLLLGLSLGKAFGFSGQVAVVEGEAFTETHIAYGSIREGRLFHEAHRGFTLALDRFDVAWYRNGVPRNFASHVRILEDGRRVRSATIRVNHPLSYRGLNIYQISWGWAPWVRVTQNGKVLSDGPVVFLPDQQSGAWRGVIKAPSAKPAQLGLEMFFYNDLELVRGIPFNQSPEPRRPIIFFRPYFGDLGLTVPQSVYALDKTRLAPAQLGLVIPGNNGRVDPTIDKGIEVSFPSLGKYSVFQVARDPGAPIMLAAAILILVGLLPALYSSRRRVWVRVAPFGDTARLEVAGQALQRRAAFEDEFGALVRELDKDLTSTTKAT